jgi:glucosamine-6-phosphate deaminase
MTSLKFGGNIDLIPKRCITIGIKEILKSKELKFYLEHDWQSVVLRKAIFNEESVSFPVTFLKNHKNSNISISRNVLKIYK